MLFRFASSPACGITSDLPACGLSRMASSSIRGLRRGNFFGRGAGGKDIAYLFQYTLHLLHDFIIPETQHRIALAAQPIITHSIICCLFGVLPAIKLNDQAMFHAYEIHNIAAHRFLTLEFQIHEAMCPQVIPQTLFGFCLMGTQGLGIGQHFFTEALSLTLSRKRERG